MGMSGRVHEMMYVKPLQQSLSHSERSETLAISVIWEEKANNYLNSIDDTPSIYLFTTWSSYKYIIYITWSIFLQNSI